jgi:hypothetical protein
MQPAPSCQKQSLAATRRNKKAGISSESASNAAEQASQDRDFGRFTIYNDGSGVPSARHAAISVFAISIAMVIGPTPPGTGVIAPARFTASA